MDKASKGGRRMSGEELTKYERPLPVNLDDFMDQYVSELPVEDWAQPLVDEFAAEITQRIRDHWATSSKTRLLFSNMNPELIWEDFDTKTMRLTKRNLATLDPRFSPTLSKYVHDRFVSYIEPLRVTIRSCLRATLAPAAETDTFMREISGTTKTDYTFANYGRHLDLAHKISAEFQAKYAAVEYCRLREQFVLRMVEWETTHPSISVDKSIRGANDLNNWIPKMRNDVVTIFEESSTIMEVLIADYEDKTGRVFTLRDVPYITSHLIKQKGRMKKVKTNFRDFVVDDLFFGGTLSSIGEPRELHASLQSLVDGSTAVPLPEPPRMPECADETGFSFDYFIGKPAVDEPEGKQPTAAITEEVPGGPVYSAGVKEWLDSIFLGEYWPEMESLGLDKFGLLMKKDNNTVMDKAGMSKEVHRETFAEEMTKLRERLG